MCMDPKVVTAAISALNRMPEADPLLTVHEVAERFGVDGGRLWDALPQPGTPEGDDFWAPRGY